MATRSAIGIRENGYIRVVYCHSDGYPEYTGAILQEHYQAESKVRKLLSLGFLSVLGERLEPRPGEPHSFDKRSPGVTVAYHRDAGDEKQPARKIKESEFIRTGNLEMDAVYLYLYYPHTQTWVTYQSEYRRNGTGGLKWSPMDIEYKKLREEAISKHWMTENKRRIKNRG